MDKGSSRNVVGGLGSISGSDLFDSPVFYDCCNRLSSLLDRFTDVVPGTKMCLESSVELFAKVYFGIMKNAGDGLQLQLLREDFLSWCGCHMGIGKGNFIYVWDWIEYLSEEDDRFIHRLQDLSSRYLSGSTDPQIGSAIAESRRRYIEFEALVNRLPDISMEE